MYLFISIFFLIFSTIFRGSFSAPWRPPALKTTGLGYMCTRCVQCSLPTPPPALRVIRAPRHSHPVSASSRLECCASPLVNWAAEVRFLFDGGCCSEGVGSRT